MDHTSLDKLVARPYHELCALYGAKAAGLALLRRESLPVPPTVLCRLPVEPAEATTAVADSSRADAMADVLARAISRLLQRSAWSLPFRGWAVRCSFGLAHPEATPSWLNVGAGAMDAGAPALRQALRSAAHVLWNRLSTQPRDSQIGCSLVLQPMISAAGGQAGGVAELGSDDTLRGEVAFAGGSVPITSGTMVNPPSIEGGAGERLRTDFSRPFGALRRALWQLRRLPEFASGVRVEFVLDRASLWLLQVNPIAAQRSCDGEPAASTASTGSSAAAGPTLAAPFPAAPKPESAWVSAAVPASLVPQGYPRLVAEGLGAMSGCCIGQAVFGLPSLARWEVQGKGAPAVGFFQSVDASDLTLVRRVDALVVASGGLTCHAAILARSLAKPCIVSCQPLRVRRESAIVGLTGTEHGSPEVLVEGARCRVDVDHGKGRLWLP